MERSLRRYSRRFQAWDRPWYIRAVVKVHHCYFVTNNRSLTLTEMIFWIYWLTYDSERGTKGLLMSLFKSTDVHASWSVQPMPKQGIDSGRRIWYSLFSLFLRRTQRCLGRYSTRFHIQYLIGLRCVERNHFTIFRFRFHVSNVSPLGENQYAAFMMGRSFLR